MTVPPQIMGPRIIPVSAPVPNMSATSNGEPMEVSSPTNTTNQSMDHDSDMNGNGADRSKNSPLRDQSSASSNAPSNMPAPPPAAAAVHQPKIVQTAFIHKLYNMLEDPNIQHLISWSPTGESFVMSPSTDFSKVLSQYFKHTNISSFVRQLNMYGFHKERDVFHTGNPDSTLWEFKHGNGSFKRGDLVSLREIKRRASRHGLVNRDSTYTKPVTSSQPGTPAEPVQLPPETTEGRLANLEHSRYDLSARLQRSEESAHYLNMKNQAILEAMGRLVNVNQELSRAVLSLAPPESQVHREVIALQSELHRQADALRSYEEPPEPSPYLSSRQQYLGTVENAPVSPRQLPQDDSRRGLLQVPQVRGPQNFHRPPVPSNLSVSTRRPYGSISGSSTTQQSSPLRNAAAPPPSGPQHPLANVETPPSLSSLGRRHTAADIRAHGWQPGTSPLPASSTPPVPWPSSPGRLVPEDQRIRESLSSFSLHAQHPVPSSSRPTTPPPPFSNGGASNADTFGGWSWNSANSRDKALSLRDSSAPPTRRGSMAHILNPSDTMERPEEDEDPRGDDDRKRKRMQ
jgi:hypothetical protein